MQRPGGISDNKHVAACLEAHYLCNMQVVQQQQQTSQCSRPDTCSRMLAAPWHCQHNRQAVACMGAYHLRYNLSQKGGPGISSPASRACEGDLQHKG